MDQIDQSGLFEKNAFSLSKLWGKSSQFFKEKSS